MRINKLKPINWVVVYRKDKRLNQNGKSTCNWDTKMTILMRLLGMAFVGMGRLNYQLFGNIDRGK